MDEDGRPELLAGNLGFNSQIKANEDQPATLVYKDFDGNGTVDPILNFYIQDEIHPFITRDELANQVYGKKTRFHTCEQYASAGLGDMFTKKELKDAATLLADNLATCLFTLDENNRFQPMALPIVVQFAPVFALQTLSSESGGRDFS
ncbi:hypothetical protein [Pararhodonellum marinum]|uniref:hypothetical protein n=1 Tax=Pararhodonellum marinum TaxID=2755358 RepID=UPI00188F5E9B|nr:hypothetical protein [Pararhodonellum marinum]